MRYLEFLSGGMLGSLFQLLYGGILYILFSFIRLFLPYQHLSPLIIETLIFACFYGFGWFFYWKFNNRQSRKQVIWKIGMVTLPLFIPLILFDPSDKPMAMIPFSFADYRFNFMLFVTTLILFPIYSFLLSRHVFAGEANRVRKTTFTFAFLFLIGTCCAFMSWSIMPLIYKK
ncbi:hypothetical protein [Neobacillus dielmonensis]|uniref:hypothetical protein n=1 Tax=Neobacillus dielmonensis TaxID=1347369 RepID=UPI0005AA2F32|nr:hypothetical protein [Neobacillus dielmonensis]